jgi:Trypsin
VKRSVHFRRSAARLAISLAASLPIVLGTTAARSQVPQSNGPVTSITSPQPAVPGTGIDFGNAKPMPLPSVNRPPASPQAPTTTPPPFGAPGVSPGSPGNAQQNPQTLPAPAPQTISPKSGIRPQEFGTSGQPYTTSQVDATGDYTASFYPFSAAGKLFFNIGADTFVCSASLVTPGVVVTAAHCVANYGQTQFYSNWVYVPSYESTNAP